MEQTQGRWPGSQAPQSCIGSNIWPPCGWSILLPALSFLMPTDLPTPSPGEGVFICDNEPTVLPFLLALCSIFPAQAWLELCLCLLNSTRSWWEGPTLGLEEAWVEPRQGGWLSGHQSPFLPAFLVLLCLNQPAGQCPGGRVRRATLSLSPYSGSPAKKSPHLSLRPV
jgi:hypothetical protein